MGSDDVSTGLVLGLTHRPKAEKSLKSCHLKKRSPSSNFGTAFLTLGFYDETNPMATNSRANKQLPDEPHDALRRQASASYSSSLKRDRDFCDGDEVEAEAEVELERISSRLSEEEDDGAGSPRKKLRLTKDQSAILEYSFKEHATLNPKQKQELAGRLSLSTRQVEVWFQNRRARTKLKQTEESCELLKKCCESLTEENQRLKKELQDIKSIKPAAHPPFYMQLQTATLSMCPSCERICSIGDGSSPTSTLSVGPKSNLCNSP